MASDESETDSIQYKTSYRDFSASYLFFKEMLVFCFFVFVFVFYFLGKSKVLLNVSILLSRLPPSRHLPQTYVPALMFSQSCHASSHCSFSIHDILLDWNSYGSCFSNSERQMSVHSTTQPSGNREGLSRAFLLSMPP